MSVARYIPLVTLENRRLILIIRLVNLFFGLGIFVVNALATALPLGGRTTGQLSDLRPTLITPAGYAFSIWGLIYAFLAAFLIYQLFPSTFKTDSYINRAVNVFFVVNALGNIGWILSWQFQAPQSSVPLWVSLMFMSIILFTLITIYTATAQFVKSETWAEYLCVRVPFGLYLGWIIAAFLINLFVVGEWYPKTSTDALATADNDPLFDTYKWASIGAICGAGAVGVIVALVRRDPVPAIPLAWASIAIYMKQTDESVKSAALGVGIGLGVFCLVVAAWNINRLIVNKKKRGSVNNSLDTNNGKQASDDSLLQMNPVQANGSV